MIKNKLANHILFSDQQLTWQDAIKLAAKKLVDDGSINHQYIQDMILNIEKNGAYVVLVPHIALPHAHSNGNVFATSISCLKLTHQVQFPDDEPVSILFVLATNDDSHLDMLADFADILVDRDKVNQLKQAQTEQQLLSVFN